MEEPMSEPLVSVVVPCYNAEKTLKKTLLSVSIQMQQYPNCEVIVVDDGSSDNSAKMIRQFEEWDKRFKGVNQKNRGVSAARNKGVEVAKGDYIAFLDADDLFLEKSLTERMRVLIEEDDPNMLGVFCPAVFIDINGKVLRNNRHFDYSLPNDRLYFSFVPDSAFNPSCVIVKKYAFLKAGGFDETIAPAEDYDLWHRMMRGGGYFKKAGSCSIGWRQHVASACHTNILRHYKQCRIVTQRVFSCSGDEDAAEFKEGFGQAMYYQTLTRRAFNSAVLAVVSGQREAADEIASDISRISMEQMNPVTMESSIKFQSLRAYCKTEEEWVPYVWPKVRSDVLKFIIDLNKKLGENCNTLLSLIDMLCQIPADTGIKIIYIPGFYSKEELSDQYYRMMWYINPILENVDKIYLPVSFDDFKELKMPLYLDTEIKKFEARFDGKIVLFPSNEIDLWTSYLRGADLILKWKNEFEPEGDNINLLIKSALDTKKTWRVDHRKERYAGSYYLKVSHDNNRNGMDDLHASHEKFKHLANTIRSEKGYIFGTGPSLSEALDYDFSDGVTIACNSMVKNEALLKHLAPKIIVFGDPIFHAGCSSYAGEFRRHLYKVIETYNPFIVVPFRDYKVYMQNLRQEYTKKIIGIPMDNIDFVNLDLKEKFIVKSTQNILTLMLMPLACTLFSEIGILGCDGRKMEDNLYFWSHHKESQLNHQMDAIKEAHPAFFEIDYNDYYLTHCKTLDDWLKEAEKKGIIVRNLTNSYIPALLDRFYPPMRRAIR